MTPNKRLARMRRMFDKKRAILTEDYEFFGTKLAKLGVYT